MDYVETIRPVGLRENLQNVLKFLVLIKPYWKNIAVFIISGLILTLLSLPFPWLTKMMIDDVMLRQDQSLLYVILISTFILMAARALLSSLREYFVSYVQHKMAFDIEFGFLNSRLMLFQIRPFLSSVRARKSTFLQLLDNAGLKTHGLMIDMLRAPGKGLP